MWARIILMGGLQPSCSHMRLMILWATSEGVVSPWVYASVKSLIVQRCCGALLCLGSSDSRPFSCAAKPAERGSQARGHLAHVMLGASIRKHGE